MDEQTIQRQPAAEVDALRQRVAELEAREVERAAELAIVNQVGQSLASELELGALIELTGEMNKPT